jgi:hypothetical protein
LPFTKCLKIVIRKWAPYCAGNNIIIDKHILVKALPLPCKRNGEKNLRMMTLKSELFLKTDKVLRFQRFSVTKSLKNGKK